MNSKTEKVIKVNILGQDYFIKSSAKSTYFKQVSEHVNNTMNEIINETKIDPNTQVEKIILSKKYGTKSDIEKIDKKVKKIIAECEEFSESSPFPDTSVMYDVVYEQNDYPFIKHKLD